MSADRRTALPADEVHVWTFAVTPSTADERWLDWLSEQERERHDRFLFEKDRRLFRAAHAMVRSVLSKYAAVAESAWRFGSNAFGRPHVVAPHEGVPIHFNLSHTQGMAVVAVSQEPEVGVDVERAHRPNVGVDLAERYFSRAEVEHLAALSPEEQPRRFLEIWTLKEAYIKARGKGLAIPLSDFSFQFPGEAPLVSFAPGFDDQAEEWLFAQRLDFAEHLFALAVRRRGGRRWRILWREWSPSTDRPES